MSKLFLIPVVLFLLATFAACQGGQHSEQVNLDTVMLAVPPMFDAPLPTPTSPAAVLVPLATDSAKKDSLRTPAHKPSGTVNAKQPSTSHDTAPPHASAPHPTIVHPK